MLSQQLYSIFHIHARLAYLCHQEQKRGGQQQLEDGKDDVNKMIKIQCQGLFQKNTKARHIQGSSSRNKGIHEMGSWLYLKYKFKENVLFSKITQDTGNDKLIPIVPRYMKSTTGVVKIKFKQIDKNSWLYIIE